MTTRKRSRSCRDYLYLCAACRVVRSSSRKGHRVLLSAHVYRVCRNFSSGVMCLAFFLFLAFANFLFSVVLLPVLSFRPSRCDETVNQIDGRFDPKSNRKSSRRIRFIYYPRIVTRGAFVLRTYG